MRTIFAAALAATATGRTLWTDLEASPYSYDLWLAEHGARYPGRREVFESNLAVIRAHNADPSKTWKMGVNQFSALTKAEFKSQTAGYNKRQRAALREFSSPAPLSSHVSVADLPASVDWRTKGVVTPVKDQGQCGGCWSFSAAETMESAVAIATGTLEVLSEQQLIDCTPNPNQCGGTGGCSGATQELAFNYTIAAGGLSLEKDYPYTAQTGTCQTSRIKPAGQISSYVTLPFNNYTALMNGVALVGPMAISAAAEPWQSYESGVFSSDCGADVDHAIVLEGYGHDDTANLDYYLVRNSWSAGWGEQGYIRVARYGSTSAGEPCVTDNTPGDGDGCANGPPSIQVCGLCGILSDTSYPLGAVLL